ncbi:MAG: hypothetical protein OWS74_07195 [Firmicutes bacterium]|nr:hypothetical protein [Bacillota bacterium]
MNAPNNMPIEAPIAAEHNKTAMWFLLISVVITLFTYQVFHHGLWGKLISLGKQPKLVLKGSSVTPSMAAVKMFNVDGPSTYGAFTTQISLSVPGKAAPIEVWNYKQLSMLPTSAIHNKFHFQTITTGPYGLVNNLASEGVVDLPLSAYASGVISHSSTATISVEDVNGKSDVITVPVS